MTWPIIDWQLVLLLCDLDGLPDNTVLRGRVTIIDDLLLLCGIIPANRYYSAIIIQWPVNDDIKQ